MTHNATELEQLTSPKQLAITFSLLGGAIAFTVSSSQLAVTVAGIVLTAAVVISIAGFTVAGALLGVVAGVLVAASLRWSFQFEQAANLGKLTDELHATEDIEFDEVENHAGQAIIARGLAYGL